MRPWSALRDEVTQRNPGSLTPIALDHAPDEVKPLVGSLNDLLSRLGDALRSQRRFTADAAHELRTPLTAVKLQFQLLERSQTAEDRSQAVENLKAGIERAIHLVQQLLTLARLEPGPGGFARSRVSLAEMARQALADFGPLAAQKRLSLAIGRCDVALVEGDEEQLRTLVNNLVDNAIRYTPEGGEVEVSVSAVQKADGNC